MEFFNNIDDYSFEKFSELFDNYIDDYDSLGLFNLYFSLFNYFIKNGLIKYC